MTIPPAEILAKARVKTQEKGKANTWTLSEEVCDQNDQRGTISTAIGNVQNLITEDAGAVGPAGADVDTLSDEIAVADSATKEGIESSQMKQGRRCGWQQICGSPLVAMVLLLLTPCILVQVTFSFTVTVPFCLQDGFPGHDEHGLNQEPALRFALAVQSR